MVTDPRRSDDTETDEVVGKSNSDGIRTDYPSTAAVDDVSRDQNGNSLSVANDMSRVINGVPSDALVLTYSPSIELQLQQPQQDAA